MQGIVQTNCNKKLQGVGISGVSQNKNWNKAWVEWILYIFWVFIAYHKEFIKMFHYKPTPLSLDVIVINQIPPFPKHILIYHSRLMFYSIFRF